MALTRKERTLGCLWAMACGDALGVPSSFLTPEQIKSKYGWIDTFYPPEKGHIFHDGLLAGEYTDDTEQSMALMNAYIRDKKVVPMSVVKEICDKVAILDGGEVAEEGLVSAVFAAPKSAAGRRLVFPGGADALVSDPASERRVRLIFRDSQTTGIPLVARLAAEESIYCNVISASTQKLSREVYGSMLLGIPSAHFDRAVDFIKAYPNIQVEEVEHHVQ